MTFHDFTLLGGRVRSERLYDTGDLVPQAVQLAGRMLRRSRRRGEWVGHGQEELPPFELLAGLEPEYPQRGAEHLFCVRAVPGVPAFQINCVLTAAAPEESALYGLGTVLTVSRGGPPGGFEPLEFEEVARPLYESRPVLATALLPLADPETIRVAADFATCVAAAWLLEVS
jgi:hypothetical protein